MFQWCGKEIKEQLANIPAQSNLHHPIFIIQSSSSCSIPQQIFRPRNCRRPCRSTWCQAGGSTIHLPSEYVTRGWLKYNSKWFSWYDIWSNWLLNGVEWCWMNHLLLDSVFASTLHDGLAMTCISACEIAGSQLCPACHWRPTARLTSSGWLPSPARRHISWMIYPSFQCWFSMVNC